MRSRLRAVFFDAGHTLVEPRVPVPEIYLREARALGARLEPDAFHERMRRLWSGLTAAGRGATDLTSSEAAERAAWHAFTLHVAEPFPTLRSRHQEWLDRLVAYFDAPEAWRPAVGSTALLQELREADLKLGVISNWHGALHGILEGLGLRPLLDFVLVSAEHGWRKPHASIFEAALRRAGVTAGQALHVGDSLRDDVEGARSAGMEAVLLAASDEGRSAAGEVRVIRTLGQLGNVLRSIEEPG